jgi:hypothetical protein
VDEDGMSLRAAAGLEVYSAKLLEMAVLAVIGRFGDSESRQYEKRVHRQNLPRRQ